MINQYAADRLPDILPEWTGDIPSSSGTKGEEWDENLYQKASRYVKIDFSKDKPEVSVYKAKSMKMDSAEMREALYRDLKIMLLGDAGRVLLEQYQKRFSQEPATTVKTEEYEVAFQKMYNDTKELIHRVVTRQPLWGGVADINATKAEELLERLLDFKTDPNLESLLREAKSIIDRLQDTVDMELQKDLQIRLEEVYKEMEKVKKPTAEEFRTIIKLPEIRGVKHEKYYLALDKKRRVEVLKILLAQLHPSKQPTHTGYTVKEIEPGVYQKVGDSLSLVFNPKDDFPFLTPEGVPTMTETGTKNENYGKDIDLTKYPVNPIYKERVRKFLKVRLLRMIKESIIQDTALAYDPQGSAISVADLGKETMDLRTEKTPGKETYRDKLLRKEKEAEESGEAKANIDLTRFRFLSAEAEIPNIVYMDMSGKLFNSKEDLLKENFPVIKDSINTEILSEIDDELMNELSMAEEYEEELALAAGIKPRIIKIAKEIESVAKEESQRLLKLLEQ